MQLADLTEGSFGEPYPDRPLRHVSVGIWAWEYHTLTNKILVPSVVLFILFSYDFVPNTATWLAIHCPIYLRSKICIMSDEMLGDDCNWILV